MAKKIILAFICTTIFISCEEGTKSNRIKHSDILAYNLLSDQIKEQILKSPSSAIFPSSAKKVEHTSYLGDHTYFIDSYVESQNGFGAMVKTRFSSKVVFLPNGGVSFPEFQIKN